MMADNVAMQQISAMIACSIRIVSTLPPHPIAPVIKPLRKVVVIFFQYALSSDGIFPFGLRQILYAANIKNDAHNAKIADKMYGVTA